MFNVGSPELLVILVVALLVLGPNKLPEAARQVGRAMGELRRLSSGFQAELRDALEEPVVSRPVTPEPAVVAEVPATIEATFDVETAVSPARAVEATPVVASRDEAGPDEASTT